MENQESFEIVKMPRKILIFSGKRKSGKDHITNLLFDKLNKDNARIVKLSGPIKAHWAESQNLDLNLLLGDGEYKEQYRQRMITWSEEIRNKDHGYFCRAAIKMYNAWEKPIWIVSDARRKSDVQWFLEKFGKDICKTIRIYCDDKTREERGWSFVAGVDDAETECGLDDLPEWDLKLSNNNDSDMDKILSSIIQFTS